MTERQTGRIIRSLSGFYDLQLADGQILRARARGEFRKSKQKPLVGDFADFESANGDGFIWALHPRQNELVRPPVANIDIAVIVTAIREPNFSANLLDRQLVALSVAGVTPALYFTKADCLSAEEWAAFAAEIAIYREIGYAVFLPKRDDPRAAQQALYDHLQHNVAVVMGQTGAGKSTLLNALAPELALQTGEVSQALSRGRHTTRQVSLVQVGQALIADTPGFSSYEVFDFPVAELAQHFPDLWAVAAGCQFRGCQHLNEPNCAVKAAVAIGTLSQSRYNSYKSFHALITAQKPKYQRKR